MIQDTITQIQPEAHNGPARAMLDAMPLCATLWHSSLNIITCNAAVLRLFGLKDAQEYIRRFDTLSPEFQPDGQISAVKLATAVRKTFAEGENRLDWLHQTPQGELIPAELTFARIQYDGQTAVAGYTRDKRAQAKAISELQYRDKLLSSLNNVSTALLSVKENDSFCAAVHKSLEIIGNSFNADRVRIWRNENHEGKLCFVGRYHWLGERGKKHSILPDGVAFPYAERPAWERKFLFGETINGPLSDLPLEESLGLERCGTKSIVILPLFLQDEFWGLFHAESCSCEKTCSHEEINFLRSAGLMIVSAINRHEQAAATREADERAQLMLDTTPLACVLIDTGFKRIDCNREMLNLLGLRDKDMFLESFFNYMPARQTDGSLSRLEARKHFDEALTTGYARFKWTFLNHKGETIPGDIELLRIKYKGGYAVASYVHDLREHQQMMREIERRDILLRELNHVATVLLSVKDEEQFRSHLNESLRLVGVSLDLDRVQLWCNETVEGEAHFALRYEWFSETGKKSTPMPIGLSFPYKLQPEWYHKFLKDESVSTPISTLPPEQQKFLKTHEMTTVAMIPLFLQEKFWGFFSVGERDSERVFTAEELGILRSAGLMMISALSRHEQAVSSREADERMSLMFDIMPAGALFFDQNGLVDYNRRTLELFGYKKMPKIKSFSELSPKTQPDGSLSLKKTKDFDAMLEGKDHARFEWMFKRKDGEELPCEVTLLRVEHKGGHMVAGFLRDLRAYKTMQREINKAAIAEESNKAKSKFLATMSHEMRTPLNAVIGIVDILSQDPELTPDKREAMQKIYSSGHLLLGIINDLLDLSKIEAGKMELMIFPYELASLIHDTVNLNLMRMGSKQIEFKLEIGEGVPTELYGDELRIKQILNNVLSNSFKYTEAGEISLTVLAEREKIKSGYNSGLVFKIKDTGAGMSKQQLAVMFEEYSRFTTEATRATEGTGLGMSITRNLVKLMNGEISVISEVGKGTEFTIMLPQRVVSQEVMRPETIEKLKHFTFSSSVRQVKSTSITREPMPYGKVLIVDDVDTNIYVAKGLMAFYRLQIDTAASGYEAIEKVEAGNLYDVIFMDHMMPQLDGIEATKIIRKMGYVKPIVALTANAVAGQAELFLASGFDAFVSKPIDIRELNAALNKYVRDPQPPEVLEAAHHDIPEPNPEEKGVPAELAKIFTRDAERAIATLEGICGKETAQSDDLAPYTIQAHAMKAALANIGQTELAEVAGRLEEAGREKNAEIVREETPAFVEMLSALIKRLATPEKPTAAPLAAEKQEWLITALRDVAQACEGFNKKVAKEKLALLKKEPWPRNIQDLLEKLAINLLHSEFEEAAGAIEECLKGLER